MSAADRLRCVSAAALLLLGAGCAKRGAPSGGPPDLEAPFLVSSEPDSGASRAPRSGPLRLVFSEGMEPRSTADAVALAPAIPFHALRWSGRTLSVVLAESLRAAQTYVLVVGGGARDRHGNPIRPGATVIFTTADSFPPGGIAGTVVGRGIQPAGAYLWCYPSDRQPDSTARDFDALGIADAEGRFRVLGLAVPGRYHLYAFVDVNRNRSFEPRTDILAGGDTTFDLTPSAARVEGFQFLVVNPRAPGRLAGTVLDSLGGGGRTRLLARWVAEPPRTSEFACDQAGHFSVELPAGEWELRGYGDANANGRWDPASDPASRALLLRVEPASEHPGIQLWLEPPSSGGP